jgi:hypothetical protein
VRLDADERMSAILTPLRNSTQGSAQCSDPSHGAQNTDFVHHLAERHTAGAIR